MIYSVNGVRYNSNYLVHHGILGQRWGVRRYQNSDGTLTNAGKAHYRKDSKQYDRLAVKYGKSLKTYDKRKTKFQKTAKRLTITDIDLELKKRRGVKLAKAYRSYSKITEKSMRQFFDMQSKYGLNNLSSDQIEKGEAYIFAYWDVNNGTGGRRE